MKYQINRNLTILLYCLIVLSCSKKENSILPIVNPEVPIPGIDVVKLPIVIHVIHNGEEIGIGPNLSTERILRQIEIINEDFRKKEGTRGYNNHPDGADSKIEFVLAKLDPESNPINGINRIDASQHELDQNFGYSQNHFAQYAYWNPSKYINVWVTPLPESMKCIALGVATGPITDLPGTQHLQLPGPDDPEGILINWIHFGESDIDCHAKYGRTLTHELGHYLGLLHTWGGKICELNDYCNDTPAVDSEVFGNSIFNGCDGAPVMIGNYMNYTHDEVMNIFTNDQVSRMHYVLKNHAGRQSLMISPALGNE